jgi:hypothetical protein
MRAANGQTLHAMKANPLHFARAALRCALIVLLGAGSPPCARALPVVSTPDPAISEVFRGNWVNTLQPCELQSGDPDSRPWMVDARNHYTGWYPAIDEKYQVRDYLFCEKNLELVLTAWQHTNRTCRLGDGGVIACRGYGVGTVGGYISNDRTTITYPLRASASIDCLLIGDMIFRFSQDRAWLSENIQYMRDTARWLEGWIDDQGLLDGQDYDHDSLMRRGTDGTCQASAIMAFRKLAALEDVLGHADRRDHYEQTAARLTEGAGRVLWDDKLGYFYEYVETNNIARSDRLGYIGGVSSELGPEYAAAKAIDGVLGYGTDGVNIHAGNGQREWASKGENVGAWIQVNLRKPTAVNRVILYNRQDLSLWPYAMFATGRLDFSDGSSVPVTFGTGIGSRAVVPFESRTVSWVKFTGVTTQELGPADAGLAEFEIHPAAEPYLKHTHGMSDANFALVGYGVADDAQARSVWKYFRAHEDAFYFCNGVPCPTWTAELPGTYTGDELNSINPTKDCTAFGRVWRHDVWMRRRMGDAPGIYKTVGWVNALYHRPSGGGDGFFGERYNMGRFIPGDDAVDSTPAYAEYPAEYNATVVGEVVMGVTADVHGMISIDPCAPDDWYRKGFGIENPGILRDRDIGFAYKGGKLSGWIRGTPGNQSFRVLLPPGVRTARVLDDGKEVPHSESGGYALFTLDVAAGRTHSFSVEGPAGP